MGGGMEAHKNTNLSRDWSSARENLEHNFRWTRRNFALVGLFGIAVPPPCLQGHRQGICVKDLRYGPAKYEAPEKNKKYQHCAAIEILAAWRRGFSRRQGRAPRAHRSHMMIKSITTFKEWTNLGRKESQGHALTMALFLWLSSSSA
ncbi:hypothetical protein SDJN03_15087, partial [Cucurbita argyrosperma subsp. sororia]